MTTYHEWEAGVCPAGHRLHGSSERLGMGWDPAVLRKYNTTGHFRLLNQVRAELKNNPLIRPKDGETVGAANRSRSLIRALEVRPQGGYGRSRRSQSAASVVQSAPSPAPAPTPAFATAYSQAAEPAFSQAMTVVPIDPVSASNAGFYGEGHESFGAQEAGDGSGNSSFRDRLNAIDMR
jgi:hypothetical protein